MSGDVRGIDLGIPASFPARPRPGGGSPPGASGGTYTEAQDNLARATFSFTGTAVSWISARYTTTGIAHVYVDGTLVATVDTYGPSLQMQVVMFTATGLPRGPHTIAIEATGTANPAACQSCWWVVVDAFDVTP